MVIIMVHEARFELVVYVAVESLGLASDMLDINQQFMSILVSVCRQLCRE